MVIFWSNAVKSGAKKRSGEAGEALSNNGWVIFQRPLALCCRCKKHFVFLHEAGFIEQVESNVLK